MNPFNISNSFLATTAVLNKLNKITTAEITENNLFLSLSKLRKYAKHNQKHPRAGTIYRSTKTGRIINETIIPIRTVEIKTTNPIII